MAVSKTTYNGAAAITLTVASMAHAAGQEGTLVDNSSNLYLDAELQCKVKMGASAPSGDLYVLVSSSIDGSTYSDPATGSNAALTPTQLDKLGALNKGDLLPGTGLRFLGRIPCLGHAAAATVVAIFGSIAELFGGVLPTKWAPVLVNMTGQALDSTAGNHVIQYNGITVTTA